MNKKIITTLCGRDGYRLFEKMAGKGAFVNFEKHLVSASLELGFMANDIEWDSFSLLEFSYNENDEAKYKSVCFFPRALRGVTVASYDLSVLAFGVIITVKALNSFIRTCDSDSVLNLEASRTLINDFIHTRSDSELILKLCA